MAKTILEDISAFLANKNTEFLNFNYDIKNLEEQDINNLIFIKEIIDQTTTEIFTKLDQNNLEYQTTIDMLNSSMELLDKQLNLLKLFSTKEKAERIIDIKKLQTELIKFLNFIKEELTGAAEDRVDIRQELGYEIIKRREQDNVLNSKIESEIVDRIFKQKTLTEQLNASIALTNTEILNQKSFIDTEIANRIAKDTEIIQSITTESALRSSADNILQSNITTLNTNLDVEKATRLSNDNILQTNINLLEETFKEIVTEIETRRISDLGILAARDNLEETQSKERDYKLLNELRDIYSIKPLKDYQNGVYDYDHLNSSDDAADATSTATSAGKNKHGIVSNIIRKLNILGKKIQGKNSDIYDDDEWSSTNNQIGLDYWIGSEFKTIASELLHRSGTTGSYKQVLSSDYASNLLNIGNGFNIVSFLSGFFTLNKSTKTIESNTVTTINMSSATSINFNTASGIVKCHTFNGIATSAKYADIAERYYADNIYDEGIVLGIGGNNEVTIYNPHLAYAGVVSKNPAYMMNNKYNIEDFKEKEDYLNYNLLNPFIALKCRIPVKLDGSVKKGQYIIAYKNGLGIAVDKHNLPTDYSLILIGIALADSNVGIVEVKV